MQIAEWSTTIFGENKDSRASPLEVETKPQLGQESKGMLSARNSTLHNSNEFCKIWPWCSLESFTLIAVSKVLSEKF